MSSIENMNSRLYRYFKEKGVDVRGLGQGQIGNYASGGAGSSAIFKLENIPKKQISLQDKNKLKSMFSAQATPELAFQRYMEFNAFNLSDYSFDLFSPETKIFFNHWRTSAGQRRAEYEACRNLKYIKREKGRFAVLMAPFNNDVNQFMTQVPYFFIKGENGWQIDINTMGRSLIMGGPSWHFLSFLHPYSFAFKNYLIKGNRYFPLFGQKAFLGIDYSFMSNNKEGFTVFAEWGSPAEKAGLLENDILIAVDGKKIKDEYQDWAMIQNYEPGDIVSLEIKRANKRVKLKARLEEISSYTLEFPYIKQDGDPWCGLYLAYSQPYERKIEDAYVSVVGIVKGGPAEKAGFEVGDLIYSIPGVKKGNVTVYEYVNFLKRVKPGDKVKFKVLRNLKTKLTLNMKVGEYFHEAEGF